jgi:ribonuclease HI
MSNQICTEKKKKKSSCLEAKRAVIDFLSSTNPQKDLVIYTDGSVHPEEGLGATALKEDGRLSHLRFLGPPGTASNFECELVGIRLGLELGIEALETRRLERIILLMDNQAAIERLKNPDAAKPGQYLLSQIRILAEAVDLATHILIRWCPGHSDIAGNELADDKAAEARDPELLDPTICDSLALEKTRLISRSKVWKGAPRAPFPVQAAFQQLSSGHVDQNAFQFKSKKLPFPIQLRMA